MAADHPLFNSWHAEPRQHAREFLPMCDINVEDWDRARPTGGGSVSNAATSIRRRVDFAVFAVMVHGGRLNGVVADDAIIDAGAVNRFKDFWDQQCRQNSDHRQDTNHFDQRKRRSLPSLNTSYFHYGYFYYFSV